MPSKSLATFYGPAGITAELGREGEFCWLAIGVEPAEQSPPPDAVRIELLYQSRDEHGLPRGPCALLFEDIWLLDAATAFGWLPRGLKPADAKKFYFRITPITMGKHSQAE